MRQSTFMCLITDLPSRLLQWTAAVREIPALRRRLRQCGPHLDYLVGAGLLEKALCQTRKYQLTTAFTSRPAMDYGDGPAVLREDQDLWERIHSRLVGTSDPSLSDLPTSRE